MLVPRLETVRPLGATVRRHARSRLLILDVGAGHAVVVHADGRSQLAKLKILSVRMLTGNIFLNWQDFLTGKIS